jgi:MYXO-CTERM domain-containing protein
MPGGGSSSGGTDGGIDLGGGLNLGGTGSSNGTAASSNGPRRVAADPGCACEVVGSSRSGTALFLAGLAAAVALGRRRRNAA